MKKNLLDDPKIIKKYDASGMLKLIESFHEQCEKASVIGNAFSVPGSLRTGCNNIVFTGLGGSAIGADIIRSYVAGEIAVPIIVNRNYALPKFVDNMSLVVVSSYSGNTEETISAYKDAKAKGAKIAAITSGGTIEKLANGDGYPVIKIPGGLPPRCALGLSFFPALILLAKLGLIKDKSEDIAETIAVIKDLKDKKIGAAIPSAKNIAKEIAEKLCGKYTIIYAAQDHIDCVATRWRGQIAENSKALASTHLFPEMNHNEIVGWKNPCKLMKDLVAVILRDAGDSSRISRRMDITKKIISEEKAGIVEISSLGKSLLARIFSLIYIGDFMSFYLAILNGCDPTPVDSITYLKEELAKG